MIHDLPQAEVPRLRYTPLPMNLLAFQSHSESRAQGAAKSTSPSSRRAQRHFPPPRLLEKVALRAFGVGELEFAAPCPPAGSSHPKTHASVFGPSG